MAKWTTMAALIVASILVIGGIRVLAPLTVATTRTAGSAMEPVHDTREPKPALDAPALRAAGGSDTAIGNGPIARYVALARCAKYERLRSFAQKLKEDPHSWLNHEPTRALLSPTDLQEVERSFAFVEANRAGCEPVPPRTEETMIAVYAAALAAARAGDLAAARCFVAAPWPNATGDELPMPQIRDLYVANVHGVVDTSLKAGDWTMAGLMASQYASFSHDALRQRAFPGDPAKAYAYQQLIALGTAGAERARQTEWLAQFGQQLTPEARRAQDAWAAQMHAKHFGGRPYMPVAPPCDY